MNLTNNEPKECISYINLISKLLRQVDHFINPTDVIGCLGEKCLIDITNDVATQSAAAVSFMPNGFSQTVFKFRESRDRVGAFDIVFKEEKLISFRAQLFFRGLLSRAKATSFFNLKFRAFMSSINGRDGLNYQENDGLYYCDFDKYTISCGLDGDTVSTWVTDKKYA
jgi:hypothetical protein